MKLLSSGEIVELERWADRREGRNCDAQLAFHRNLIYAVRQFCQMQREQGVRCVMAKTPRRKLVLLARMAKMPGGGR